MNEYIVSARKYRPSTFDSVVGQKTLTQTLKNAISSNKLAHAYLFCGPRGVGKTSCARIFAKTINCFKPTPTGEACNECESCISFNQQRSYNIHELDAASNNGIDNIKDLISMVMIPPQIGKYKIFIIDEVHMLSTAAFNAFLKTLEEPPQHVVFILATTEKHKILPTILSRCQIYDFNRISLKDTIDHLSFVARSESVNAEVEALSIIAKKADGGMRDALSTFDQLVSFTDGNLTYTSVIENLNVLDYEYYFRITDAFLANNVTEALLILNDIVNKGFDPQHFITGLSSHLRDVMICKEPATHSLIEAGPELAKRYGAQGQKCSNPFLYKALEISNECDLNYKASRNKRLLVEIALIRIAQITVPQQVPSNGGEGIKKITVDNRDAASVSSAPQPINNNPQVARPATEKKPEQPAAAYAKNEPTGRISDSIPDTPASKPAIRKVSTPVGPGARPTTGISLRGNNKKEDDTQVVKSVAQKNRESVTESKLQEEWLKYANSEEIKERTILVNTLKSGKPALVENEIVEFYVNNVQQQIDLTENAGLMIYLRGVLKNDFLNLRIKQYNKSEQKKLFSAKEKYAAMITINPDLQLLKETFNLDMA